MLYILHGADDYSKDRFLAELEKKLGVSGTNYTESNPPQDVDALLAQDLFASSQLIILSDLLDKFLTEDRVESLAKSSNHIVFLESSLDKRLKLVKQLLVDKRITAKEFAAPQKEDLPQWVASEVKARGGNIEPAAIKTILQNLGYVDPLGGFDIAAAEPSLLRLEQEILKLTTYAAGDTITSAMVHELVPDEREAVGFALIDAVAKKNRAQIFMLLDRYFGSGTTSDTQAKTIQLVGLLSDQFRSLLLVREAQDQRMSDNAIASELGWKPGRVFVIKKLTGNFTSVALRDLLTKLESLDIELKTSTLPPRTILELILAQS